MIEGYPKLINILLTLHVYFGTFERQKSIIVSQKQHVYLKKKTHSKKA